MGKGVACGHCGASTPLPEDVRVPAFRCAYCTTELQTAWYVGREVASAEQMRAYLMQIGAAPGTAPAAPVPRFESTNTATREAKCRHCGAAIAVPLDLRAKTVACPACHRTDDVSAHVSGAERLAAEMQRAMAGKQALERVQSAGVPCHKCGARNAVADPSVVQLACAHCGATILLSDHVSADAVARARMRQGLFAMRDGVAVAKRKRDHVALVVVLAVVGIVGIGLVTMLLVGGLSGR